MSHVVVLPGIMGSTLHEYIGERQGPEIWLRVEQLLGGYMPYLELAEDGESDVNLVTPGTSIRPVALLDGTYRRLLQRLKDLGYTVHPFPYDWRKSIRSNATKLLAFLRSDFDGGAGYTVVAHSMGGVVLRGAAALDDRVPALPDCQRIVYLGCPHHGSHSAAGIYGPRVGTWAPWLSQYRGVPDVFDPTSEYPGAFKTVTSWQGLADLFPSPISGPFVGPETDRLYVAAEWGPLAKIRQYVLDRAKASWEWLSPVALNRPVVYVVSSGRSTPSGIKPGGALAHIGTWQRSTDGDATVTAASAYQDSFPRFGCNVIHHEMPSDPLILSWIDFLIVNGLEHDYDATGKFEGHL